MGYINVVRVCRDCDPVKITGDQLTRGMKVLVYGTLPARIVSLGGGPMHDLQLHLDSPKQNNHVYPRKMSSMDTHIYPRKMSSMDYEQLMSVQVEILRVKYREGSINKVFSVGMRYIEAYSEVVLAANRIKNAIRSHLAYTLFRTQLNFRTWNIIETMQEQKAVQMVSTMKYCCSIGVLIHGTN